MRIWNSDPSKWLIFKGDAWWVLAPGAVGKREARKFRTFEQARVFCAGRKVTP